jgi:CRISPR-associated endonuclease/helicase Cas3
MKFSRLLAKSIRNEDGPRPEETLVGHTARVMEAASVFYETLADALTTFLGGALICFFKAALLTAAWLHDIGKANDHFQGMIRNHGAPQGLRHETFALVVIDECLRDLLAPVFTAYPAWYRSAVLFAVCGHHLKFPEDPSKNNRPRREVQYLGAHPDLRDYWKLGEDQFNVSAWKGGETTTFSLLPFGGIQEKLCNLRRHLDSDFTMEQKLFVSALKASLMVSDLAGSALPPRNLPISEWLPEHLRGTIKPSQLEQLIYQRVPSGSLRPFQKTLATSRAHTVLVVAGCGSGKTAGAYLWCGAKAEGRRLFFSYPTTATASEGFSGYLREPDFEVLLSHSRSAVDYKLLEDMPDESPTRKELLSLKLEALETWPAPAVVCTAHTGLGLLQNVRRSLYAWPSLIRSVFVFDEIHAYSPKLFSHLLRFLSVFRSQPVLLMTATLPPDRKRAILNVCEERGGIEIIEGPREREGAPRYILGRAPEEEVWSEIEKILSGGGKILWVLNTVDRAIERTMRAQQRCLPVEPYHSRFRYRDRVARHRKIVDAFRHSRLPLLAVTTQVAEMSLDLSADLLVTEYAPIYALIQRLGRLNRSEDIPAQAKKALFVRPENALPYADKAHENGFWAPVENWLDNLADGSPKSQIQLAGAFSDVLTAEAGNFDLDTFCDWLDDPWSSLKDRHSLMEAGYTIDLVREEDLGDGQLQENAIPMPFPIGRSWHRWPQKGRYLVAPQGTIEYSQFWGGRYARDESFFRVI